jgi:hypothetical protein
MEQCADEARAEDWSAELFVLSLRETLNASREKLVRDADGRLLTCEARERFVLELLDRGVRRFFEPM